MIDRISSLLPIPQASGSIETVRKLLAITLLAVFGLPLVPSLLAMAPARDADVPICCRGNGAHHCLRRASHHPSSDSPQASAACPYLPGSAAVVLHAQAFVPSVAPAAVATPHQTHQQHLVPTSQALSGDHGPQLLRGPPPSA